MLELYCCEAHSPTHPASSIFVSLLGPVCTLPPFHLVTVLGCLCSQLLSLSSWSLISALGAVLSLATVAHNKCSDSSANAAKHISNKKLIHVAFIVHIYREKYQKQRSFVRSHMLSSMFRTVNTECNPHIHAHKLAEWKTLVFFGHGHIFVIYFTSFLIFLKATNFRHCTHTHKHILHMRKYNPILVS